jgi:mannose-6-phosphate isomerase-like protein (cupin superfamily)
MTSVKTVRLEEGKHLDLGSGSWAKELLTGESVGTRKTMLAYSVFKPGTGTAARIHEEEELCFILTGKGLIQCEDIEVPVEKGMAVYIPPGVKHGTLNHGIEDLSMVYVFSYPRYPPTRM